MTPNQTQARWHQKHPTYEHCSTPSPKSRVRVALRLAVFEIFHILGFPMTPKLKFKSAIKFLKFG